MSFLSLLCSPVIVEVLGVNIVVPNTTVELNFLMPARRNYIMTF